MRIKISSGDNFCSELTSDLSIGPGVFRDMKHDMGAGKIFNLLEEGRYGRVRKCGEGM